MSPLVKSAKTLLGLGYSVLPTKANKAPTISTWKAFQKEPISQSKLEHSFANAGGIGVICGYGDLLCLDFDLAESRNILEDFFEPFLDTAQQWLDDDQYVVSQSKSGGKHIYIRVEGGFKDGNKKLAHLPIVDKNGRSTKKCFIETRGVGGYVVIPPTEGYKYQYGSLEAEIKAVPKETYELLIALAKDFSQVPTELEQKAFKVERPKNRNIPNRLSIIDIFNEKYHPHEILERNSYKLVFRGSKISKYLAPNSRSGNAGVRMFHQQDKTIAYSHHSSDILGDERGHDAFDCFRILEHGSDFDSALKTALEEFRTEGSSSKTITRSPITQKSYRHRLNIRRKKEKLRMWGGIDINYGE